MHDINPHYTWAKTDLLLQFLHLLYRTSTLWTIIVTITQANVISLANVLLLLLLCLLQFALSTETLSVVHVVRLHHLQEYTASIKDITVKLARKLISMMKKSNILKFWYRILVDHQIILLYNLKILQS